MGRSTCNGAIKKELEKDLISSTLRLLVKVIVDLLLLLSSTVDRIANYTLSELFFCFFIARIPSLSHSLASLSYDKAALSEGIKLPGGEDDEEQRQCQQEKEKKSVS